jgi:uncharacterized Fe-S cluster protein YjdI
MSQEPIPDTGLVPVGRHYASPEITVWYDVRRCRHAAECVRGNPEVFDTSRKPWIRPDLASAEVVAEVVRRCPTGALHYRLAEGPEEPAEVPTVLDFRPDGAIWVRGDLRLEVDGATIVERRAAICGCGRNCASTPNSVSNT